MERKRIRVLSFLIFALVSSLSSGAQSETFRSFLPADYDTLYDGVARGDLNKDGIEDIALALYHKAEKAEQGMDSMPPRMLIILLGTAKGYVKAGESGRSLLCRDCGGVFGDPFAGIAINGNVLELYHYGGSAWKWSYTHKFRFQNGDFFLIGKTSSSFWSIQECEALGEMAGLDYEDVNYLTGAFEVKRISEDCKLLENKKGKNKKAPLVSLNKFTIDN